MSDKNLLENRNQIDQLDKELLQLLSKRFIIVKEIGNIKKTLNLPNLDLKRFDAILVDRVLYGEGIGIDSEFTKELFELIHKEALKIEK